MNLNQPKPETSGGVPVETTPVEAQPLQMPDENQPQEAKKPEATIPITPLEQVQSTLPTVEEAQPIQQPVLSEDEKKHRLDQAVRGDVNSLSEASHLVEATSFDD